jgi:Protein of unknown function (DUF1553)/Protein of unknown function (DUF1549)/Planctomycete cytochrome C
MNARGIVVGCFVTGLLVALGMGARDSVRADAVAPAARSAAALRKIDFNRDIRPIFSDNCYFCHGPDKNRRKADLRLDTKDGLFGMKDDSYPVVPGKPDDSVLYMRITSDDPDTRMPHKDSNKRLTADQIALIKRWIEEGAEWKGHWSYVPPVRPAVPSTTQPTVAAALSAAPEKEKFVRNPIDNFIADKLGELGMHPSAEADRHTLLRRLSLDLTGLPPTQAEVDGFINDPSPDAYEKQVDRLLASPRFGERMAVMWMDLVRYGDTIGFHSDNPREVWPWRDWCINAFNRNEPFNQFTIEQVAGDLIPNATREQKTASGYNRLLLTTGEGGAQAKEYVQKYLGDRVRNVATTWLGVTMGCCQCHDHKFDPFSQKDFYRMGAFFADIQEPAISLPTPELMLPTPEQEKELNRLNDAIAAAKKKLDADTPELAAAQVKWEQEYRDKWAALDVKEAAVKWTPLTITEAKSTGGAMLKISQGKEGDTVLASGPNPSTDSYVIKAVTKLKNITALRLDALPHKSLPGGGPGRFNTGNFVLTEIDAAIDKGAGPTTQPVAFQNASASYEQPAGPESPYRKYPAQAAIDGDKFGANLGWAIADRFGLKHHAIFETAADLGAKDATEQALTITLKFNFGGGHSIGYLKLSATDQPRPIRAMPGKELPENIVALIETPAEKRNATQKNELAAYFRGLAPQLAPVRKELAEATAARDALTGPPVMNKYNQNKIGTIARTLISVAGPPRVVRVLPRGNWQDDSGEVVTPGVPAFMRQIEVPVERGPSRLDLANWLVARDNPLTARCFVNRLWKMFYGEGMAKPLDDLGAQGQWPTHPELLDWLAVDFMDSNWDVKRMIRSMVTSGTYRQQSAQPKELKEKDPYNKWVARQGTFRLDAEFVRDNALSIAGLLSPKMFGPSVRPYQPAGYWEFLNFPKRQYDQDHGDSLYRRGLYTWWQRTFLNPSLLNFDASTHEECTAERVRSNTPQQALTLLNDVTYVEAARSFAARILKECDGDTATRIAWAYRTALSRDPLPQEIPILVSLLEKQRKRYQTDVPSADALLGSGESPQATKVATVEWAAWTGVARTILNLHETITRN